MPDTRNPLESYEQTRCYHCGVPFILGCSCWEPDEPTIPADECELEFEDNGPHPGCREFADPVYSPCGGEQRFLFETDGPYGGESLRVCAYHADLYGSDPRVHLVPLV